MRFILLLYVVFYSLIAGSQTLPSYLPANGLVAWYPFNGNANDESGNGNNGTVNGAVLTNDRNGVTNRSYFFDGANDYIEVPFSTSLAIQNQISYSVWIQMDGGGCNPRVFQVGGCDNPAGSGYLLAMEGSSNISRNIHIAGVTTCNQGIGFGSVNTILNALEWNHIVFTADFSTGIGKLYFNGLLVSTSLGTSGLSLNYGGGSLYLGNIAPFRCDWYGGKIDDLAFWNRFLSDTEVQQLYSSCPFNTNFLSEDTILACGTSYTLDAGSGYSSYNWNTGDTLQSISVTSTGWYKCTVSQNGCSASDSVFVSLINAQIINSDTAICLGNSITLNTTFVGQNTGIANSGLPSSLKSGLVGYWPFNGNANDESGNGRNGTVSGAVLSTDRFNLSNSAYYFDGSGHHISASCDGFSNSERTISFWFYGNDIGQGSSGRAFLGYGGSGTCGTSSLVVIDNAALGGNNYEISGHCQNETVAYPYGVNHPNNQWIHWTITTSQNEGTKFYLNGNLVYTSSLFIQQTYTSGRKIFFGIIPFHDGLTPYWDSNVMPLNGKLDDVLIYNRELGAIEIQQLYSFQNNSYLWSTGDTISSIIVSPDQTTTYYLAVSNGISSCVDSVTVTVRQPSVFYDTIIACSNYAWNGSSYTASGVYTFASTGAGGCDSLAILNLTIKTSSSSNISIAACSQYNWNGITYTSSGSYTYTTVNSRGCDSIAILNLTITGSPVVAINAGSIACFGGSAIVSVTASGGTAPYSGTGQFTKQAGSYTFVVSDVNGCQGSNAISITQPSQLNINISTTSATNGQPNGSATANVSGGTSPYSYLWSNSATTATTVNLPAGTYSVMATDANGCSASGSATIGNTVVNESCPGFKTYTQDAWGARSASSTAAAYIKRSFSSYFRRPAYLTIGCATGNKLRLTNYTAIDNFLPSVGPIAILPTGTTTNPGSNYKNSLAGEVVALTLNVTSDLSDPGFSTSNLFLNDLVVASGPMAGLTVQQVLDEANRFLGNCPFRYTATQIYDAVRSINLNYENGTVNRGYLICPPLLAKSTYFTQSAPIEDLSVYPNPTSGNLNLSVRLEMSAKLSVSLMDLTGRQIFKKYYGDYGRGNWNFKLDLSSFGIASGVYILSFKEGDKVKNRRVVFGR